MARRFDAPRRSGPALLLILLLACFARLVADPSALIVDADRPSLDHSRRFDDPPTIGNDATRLFVPHHAAIAAKLARLGRVPAWDDRGFGGRPLVGNPQAGLFYPPNWLAWWAWSPSILGWITVVHLSWAGLGTYFLARSLDLDRWGSTVAGGCFLASPYVLAQTFEGHYPHVCSASWMPWAFLVALGLRRNQRRSGLMLVPILALAGLAGHPQEAYYLALALAFWGAGGVVGLVRAWQMGSVARLTRLGFGLVVLTIAACAIEWLPDALAGRWTLQRSPLPLAQASRYHLYPLNALQLLSPFALGRPGDYFGHDNYWESLTSIGLIPLTLAIIGIAWASNRAAVRGWVTLVVVSILFAAGRKLGLFTILYWIIPGLDRFRVPSRTLFLASLGSAVLAGMGVDALRRSAIDPAQWSVWMRRTARSAVAVAGLVLIGGWLANHRDVEMTTTSSYLAPSLKDMMRRGPRITRVPEGDRWLRGLLQLRGEPTFWLALGGIALAACWAQRRPGVRRQVASLLGLFGLVELGIYGHSLIVTAPMTRFLGPDPISAAIAGVGVIPHGPPLIRSVDSLYDDLRAGHHGFRKTNVNDSFQVEHAADLYETLYRAFDPDRLDLGRPMDTAASEFRREVRQAVLDRMGVTFLVAHRRDLDPRWTPIDAGRWDESDFAVFRNPTAMPRAYVVPRASIVRDEARMVQNFPSINPRDAVVMPADPLGAAEERQSFTPAEWARDDSDHLDLKVTTTAPGLLVIADTWIPGWSAEVDGHPATIHRGNQTQRVIVLATEGVHRIELRYKPPGLVLGACITCFSSLIWLGFSLKMKNV